MKKTLSIVCVTTLLLSLLAGCVGTVSEPSEKLSPESSAGVSEAIDLGSVRLATLKGPTTMGLVRLLDNAKTDKLSYTVENTIYGAADEITGLLINGNVDMAAIPCNLASILHNKTNGALQIAAVNTLGVLDIVELGETISSIEDLIGKTVYSTGKGTTPEFALKAILQSYGIDPDTDLNIEYKSEATEIAALLTGESAVENAIAVLPQPYASTVIMGNPEARIALELTEEWKNSGLEGNLVTGVLVVRRDFAEQNPELMKSFLTDYADSVDWVNANVEDAALLIAEAGIVPKPEVAIVALPYCNIVFLTGENMKTDVSSYLGVLFEQDPASVGGALADEELFYEA